MKTDINKYKSHSSSNAYGVGMHAFYPRHQINQSVESLLGLRNDISTFIK